MTKPIADTSEQISGFLKVAEQNFKGLGPSRTNRFLGSIDQLAEGSYLGCGVKGVSRKPLKHSGLVLGVPHLDELGLGKIIR